MDLIIDIMIFAGAALMVWNILRYNSYMKNVLNYGDWEGYRATLVVPLVLLIMFLAGYLVVGLIGRADIVMAGILFGGSIFVAIIVNTLERITTHLRETGRLEAELLAAEESSRAKTAFLSNMSHEIRTPMNAVIGTASLMLRNPDLPDNVREQMLKLDASAKHLLSLINDVLDMSRIESGQMLIRKEAFSMDELLDQVESIMRSQCDEKGLDFVREADGCEGNGGPAVPCCMGDSTRLRQVLINILGNSVKFTPAPGTIKLRIESEGCSECLAGRSGCRVRFIISDTGVGMDEEYIPKLFEAFSQEDESSTNKYGGSGLGMAITKNLTELMGGTIGVTSRKGEGTTFTVEIPFSPIGREEAERLRAEAAERESRRAGSSQTKIPEGRRILFAEDVDINAEILQDILEMEGMESERAENGKVCVEKFAASEPGYYDAILMDMRMPVMDGLEATRAIRALDREDAASIPIVALTANAFYADVQKCLEAGMNTHLSKPVDPDLLTETIARFTEEED